MYVHFSAAIKLEVLTVQWYVKGKKLFSNMKTYIQFSLKLFNFLKSILVSGTERLMAIRGT